MFESQWPRNIFLFNYRIKYYFFYNQLGSEATYPQNSLCSHERVVKLAQLVQGWH